MPIELERELELFRKEEEAAQQHFFTYLALHRIPGDETSILAALNRTPMFWLTLRHAALESAFFALGRIFDEDSAHNLGWLLRLVEQNLPEFSHSGLAARRVADRSMTQAEAAHYAAGKHELTVADVRVMRRAVATARGIWAKRYRDIRHKVFAHRGLQDLAEEQALFAQTNIGEIVRLLAFLSSLYEALWQALNNGHKPDLSPQGPAFPVPDRDHRQYPGERVYLEALEALTRLTGKA